MPFRSKAQARFMFAKHPKIAKKWAKKYGGYKNKPARVKCAKGAAGKACRARKRR